MRVKLFDALDRHLVTYALWDKAFDRWLDEASEIFFVGGGYAEIWNDREAFRLPCDAVQSKMELKRCLIAVLKTTALAITALRAGSKSSCTPMYTPVPRPFGASLRLGKIVPDDFVAPVRLALSSLVTFLKHALTAQRPRHA